MSCFALCPFQDLEATLANLEAAQAADWPSDLDGSRCITKTSSILLGCHMDSGKQKTSTKDAAKAELMTVAACQDSCINLFPTKWNYNTGRMLKIISCQRCA